MVRKEYFCNSQDIKSLNSEKNGPKKCSAIENVYDNTACCSITCHVFKDRTYFQLPLLKSWIIFIGWFLYIHLLFIVFAMHGIWTCSFACRKICYDRAHLAHSCNLRKITIQMFHLTKVGLPYEYDFNDFKTGECRWINVSSFKKWTQLFCLLRKLLCGLYYSWPLFVPVCSLMKAVSDFWLFAIDI